MLAAVVKQGVWSVDTGLAYLQRLPEEEQATACDGAGPVDPHRGIEAAH